MKVDIENAGLNELVAIEEKVYNSMLSDSEKHDLLVKVSKRKENLNLNSAIVEVAEVHFD